MATIGQGIPPVKKPPGRERSLTVMVMGKVGKVRSFRLSRRLLFWALLFFAAYLPFSAYVGNRYIELSHTNKSRQDKIERLEKDLSRSTAALSRSREHIFFLEDYIFQMEIRDERASQPARPRAKRTDDVAPGPAASKVQDKEKEIVSVEDLVMEKQAGVLDVGFKIVNLLPGDITVGGYVHMAAKEEGGAARPEWTYPQVKRADGLPRNFRQGQMFLIQRFKPMGGKLPIGSGPDAPAMLEILVYDQAGGIMLQKEYRIP